MKRAVIVGINYTGTGGDLRGCINDANAVKSLLKNHYGFTDTEIKMVLEKDATTAGIKTALEWLVIGTQPGDTLFFHYSGHGSQVYNAAGSDIEADGLDEIICPIDLNWADKIITDDYLKWIFNRIPNGANVTVVLDCCNSGTALDQVDQYQPNTPRVTTARMDILGEGSRYLPPPPHVQVLMEGKKVHRRLMRDCCYKRNTRDVNQTVILITGCRAEQTSADAFIDGKYQGAATYSLIKSLADTNYKLEYKTLIERMNKFMVDNGYTQRPELNGSPLLHNKLFLGDLGVAPGQPPAPMPAPTSPRSYKKNVLIYILIAAIITAAFVLL